MQSRNSATDLQPSASAGVPAGEPARSQAGIGGAGAAGAGPNLGEYIHVDFDQHLPEFDAPGVTAFRAQDTRVGVRKLVARVSDADQLPRISQVVAFSKLRNLPCVRPEEWGAVYRPRKNRRQFTVVFGEPSGRVVMPDPLAKIPPMAPDALIRRFLLPATAVLAEFAERSLTHRAIRPDNIYAPADPNEPILLGECVSGSPAAGQGKLFEPVESALTPVYARGVGNIRDDLYALGATALTLSVGGWPVSNMSDDKLLGQKLERGSFLALTQETQPPFRLRDMLRGLLTDNPIERWQLSELIEWLGGSVQRSIQIDTNILTGPYRFGGGEYRQRSALARAFGARPAEACKEIVQPRFLNWAQRCITRSEDADAITELVEAARLQSGVAADTSVLTRVIQKLDPNGPFRFNGVTCLARGFAGAVSHAAISRDDDMLKTLAEVFSGGRAIQWLRAAYEDEALVAPLKTIQQYLRRPGPGFGIERCLYELNPAQHCLSPIVEWAYVYRAHDLLPAIESAIARGGEAPRVADRHIAAFIAARFTSRVLKPVREIADVRGDTVAVRLAILDMLASLQTEFGPEHLPHTTTWLAKALEPAIGKFQSHTIRERVVADFQRAATGGSLVRLREALSGKARVNQDLAGRRAALQEFSRAGALIRRIKIRMRKSGQIESSRHLAARLSKLVSVAVITALIFL